MKNLFYLNWVAVQQWAADVGTNAALRSTNAMQAISNGTYGAEHLFRDLFRYAEDLADYPYSAVTGILPVAYLTINGFAGDADSNPIPLAIPRDGAGNPDLASFQLTQFANVPDGRALFDPAYASLQLNAGTKSVSVKIQAAGIPNPERPPAGLYHGGIYRVIGGNPKPAAEVHVHVI